VRARPDLRPDLVVAHGGCGAPTLFLPEIVKCPIINYCEYYFALGRCDISYRIDLPPAEPAHFYPRCINAIVLASLVDCDSGYSPTAWQRQSFPKRFWPKIEVHFDGIDTELYRPRSVQRVIAGNAVPPDTRIVTYVARGLESMRGFDQFMKVARRIYRERSDVLFVVVGSELTYYGWDKLHIEGPGARGQGSERGLTPDSSPLTPSFKQWVLSQGDYDLSRFVFIDHLLPEQLAEVLCLSDLHIYLTVPFVLSWSMLDALASGCLVLASDVPPVREVIEAGVNGLVAPFYDTELLAEAALDVLRDPAAYQPLRDAARARMEEQYSIEASIPQLRAYFERVAARGAP
jgi:glycosyltransferase involved in cell wall biosynthesis